MNWLRAIQTALLLTRQADGPEDGELCALRREFSLRFEEALAACGRVSQAPADLAAAYARRLLTEEQNPAWWRENRRFLCEEWFILRYAREHGLLPPPDEEPAPPLPLCLILPEGERRETARLTLERDVQRPECGRLLASGVQSEEAASELLRLRFVRQSHQFVRIIGECAAPLAERAVETGVALLSCGCAVCTDEESLFSRLCEGSFQPEHRHWIEADERADRLRLSYPWDRTLHVYLCQAGCHWNGRYTELPLVSLDRAADILRLYGFRATDAAQRRLDAWSEANRQATVFRARRKKRQPAPRPLDLFQQLLNRPGEVLEDLKDEEC